MVFVSQNAKSSNYTTRFSMYFPLKQNLDQNNLTWTYISNNTVTLDQWNHSGDFRTNFQQNFQKLLLQNLHVGE